jgi:hypothetical protein
MSVIKDFWSTRAKMNCAWFTIPMSIFYTVWFTKHHDIELFSPLAAQVYMVFFVLTYIILMSVFFVNFAMNRKR